MELSTYFRINARSTGQFERTLIIADEGSLRELPGRLHRADARREPAACRGGRAGRATTTRRSSTRTVQNWYPGDAEGRGGIYNFVTKRGACRGARSKITWTQVETGSAITWKYPSCVLLGRRQRRRVLLGGDDQQPPAGRYRHQDDPYRQRTKSTIVSKGISAGRSNNTYRGLVRVAAEATGARNYTQCDSLLIGDRAARIPCPISRAATRRRRWSTRRPPSKSPRTSCSTAASAGCRRRMRSSLIVNGFCKEVLKELPMEFAVEAQKLLAVSLEGSRGLRDKPLMLEIRRPDRRDRRQADPARAST